MNIRDSLKALITFLVITIIIMPIMHLVMFLCGLNFPLDVYWIIPLIMIGVSGLTIVIYPIMKFLEDVFYKSKQPMGKFIEGHKKIVKAIDLEDGTDVTKHITPEDFISVITINGPRYVAKSGKTKNCIELSLEDSQGNKEIKWVARVDDFKKQEDND